jgi:peptidoglycan hydrolase-like protein with peptidoglycan-binding domain
LTLRRPFLFAQNADARTRIIEEEPTLANSTPLLKKGSKGEAVTRLQQGLYQLGYDPGAVDGIFGPNTERAVKEFQTNNGLAADGSVGPKTWTALEEAFTSQRSESEES